MELRVLGPLEVVRPEGAVKIGGRKDRIVLAALALEPGRAVSEDLLVEAVWAGSPPRTAAKSIQNSIVQLRRVLGDGPGLFIETQPGGYRLHAAVGALDSTRAQQLIEAARAARRGGAEGEASARYREALALWRGSSLADVADASPVAMAGAVRLDELRWSAVEELIGTELARGLHHELTGELEALVRAQPLRERFWCQLMLALYRSGRQGEALRAYQRARQTLGEEIGVEPGPELRQLERAVVNQDAALGPTSGDSVAGSTGAGGAGAAGAGFVGRQREVAWLLSAVEDGRRAHGAAFLVCGEPGIGKTRLVDEVAARTLSGGSRVLWGRAWEGGGAPAFWPWTQILRALRDQAGPEAFRRLAGPGRSAVAALVPGLEEGADCGPATPPPTAERATFELFDGVTTTLVRASEDVPIVVVVDDLHAADRASLELLAFLCRGLRTTRVTVLATYRDREVSMDPGTARLVGDMAREGETLRLTGLGPDAVRSLLDHIVGDDMPDAVASTVVGATEGNPLFVTELARLIRSEPAFLSGTTVPPDRLPIGIRETIRQLLRPLTAETRELLAAAAAIGDEFTVAGLARTAAVPPARLQALLAHAATAGLIESSTTGTWSFHHGLVRETLYAELSPDERAALHARTVLALEEQHGPGPGPHAAPIAHHALRGVDVVGAEKAVRCCVHAAQAAAAVFAWGAATEQYRSALRLCEEFALDAVTRAGCLEALGDQLIDAGLDLHAGVEHLEEALRVRAETSDVEATAWVHARLGRAHSTFIQTMNMPLALGHYGQAEEELSRGPASAKLGYLYAGYAAASTTRLQPEETTRLARRGMDIADAIGDSHLWNGAAVSHGNSLVVAGRLREGLAELERVWTVSDREGFLVPAFMAVWYLTFWCTALGNPRAARRWVDLELSRPRQADEGQNRTLLLHFLLRAHARAGALHEARQILDGLPFVPTLAEPRAVVHFLAGEWQRSESLLHDYIEQARRSENGVALTLGLVSLAGVRLADDDADGAVRWCDEALDLLPATMCNAPLAYTRMPLIRALVRAGNFDRAEAEVAAVRRLMRPDEDWQGLWGSACMVDAEVAMARGREGEAAAKFEEAMAIFRRFGLVWDQITLLLDRATLRDDAAPVLASHDRSQAAELLERIGAGGRWVEKVGSEVS